MKRSFLALLLILIPITPTKADSFLVWRAKADVGKSASDLGLQRSTRWCSEYLKKLTGRQDVDDRAVSWLKRPKTNASIGSIAVMNHHVGIVSGFDPKGNPQIISGNHQRRVGEGVYPRGRILAYVSP